MCFILDGIFEMLGEYCTNHNAMRSIEDVGEKSMLHDPGAKTLFKPRAKHLAVLHDEAIRGLRYLTIAAMPYFYRPSERLLHNLTLHHSGTYRSVTFLVRLRPPTASTIGAAAALGQCVYLSCTCGYCGLTPFVAFNGRLGIQANGQLVHALWSR